MVSGGQYRLLRDFAARGQAALCRAYGGYSQVLVDQSEMPFGSVSGCDTVKVMRCGRHVYNFYIYRVENMQLDKIEQ